MPVPPTRLEHPVLELARSALIKLQSQILEEERTGVIEASAKTKVGAVFELIEQDYFRTGKKSGMTFCAAGTCISRITSPTSARANSAATTLTTISFSGSGRRQREPASIESWRSSHELCTWASAPRRHECVECHTSRRSRRASPELASFEQVEYDKLRLHSHALWLRTLSATYHTFGFRRSELLILRVRQINLIDKTIT